MRLGITDAVKHLIIINAIMFIGKIYVGQGLLFDQWFAMYFPTNDLFQPWQVLTHMFMHGDGMHIIFNMFALWMFGTPVERSLGTKKFLFIYFSAGFGALLFQLGYHYFNYYPNLQEIASLNLNPEVLSELLNIEAFVNNRFNPEVFADKANGILSAANFTTTIPDPQALALMEMNITTQSGMLGASGCIMGILAAFGVMNPNAELMMIFLPIPIKAKYFIPGIILLDLISAFTGQSFFSPSNTAYMAHVGGAVIGFIIMWFWKKTV